MSSHRILQIITRSDWGGAQRIVQSLATEIPDITAVACGPGGRLIERLEAEDITVHVQPHLRSSPHPSDILAYRDLKRLISTGDFDLVHSHSTKAGALARIAAIRSGVPSVHTVHGWGFYNTEYSVLRPIIIKSERFIEKHTDHIVCVSRNDYDEGRKHNILDEESASVIHNGIKPLNKTYGRNTLYDQFNIGSEMPIIGAIARLAAQKDPLAILKMTKKLQERGYKFATVLIGSGPLAEECQTFVNHHELKNVYLPGFRDDALELLPDFDVFLLPSKFEGFPLTVLECLHAGTPLVAHDVGGVAEAIDHGVTGFVVSPNEGDSEFTNKIETLLQNPQLRQQMSQQGQQVATTRFTEDRMVEQYRDVYQQIL